jgi:hypothetical protein
MGQVDLLDSTIAWCRRISGNMRRIEEVSSCGAASAARSNREQSEDFSLFLNVVYEAMQNLVVL